jgi:hypothetical protein
MGEREASRGGRLMQRRQGGSEPVEPIIIGDPMLALVGWACSWSWGVEKGKVDARRERSGLGARAEALTSRWRR